MSGQPPRSPPPPIPPSIPPNDPQQEGFGPRPVLSYGTPGLGIPCPNCGSTQSARVNFTWWGGLLGPRMFHHVKCLGCGCAYNSKTGRPNTTAIIIYTVVSGIVVIAAMLLLLRRL